MDEETEVGGSGVSSESLEVVCGGIEFVSVEKDVRKSVGVGVVDDIAGSELDQLSNSRSTFIHGATLGPREVEVYQCSRRGR